MGAPLLDLAQGPSAWKDRHRRTGLSTGVSGLPCGTPRVRGRPGVGRHSATQTKDLHGPRDRGRPGPDRRRARDPRRRVRGARWRCPALPFGRGRFISSTEAAVAVGAARPAGGGWSARGISGLELGPSAFNEARQRGSPSSRPEQTRPTVIPARRYERGRLTPAPLAALAEPAPGVELHLGCEG